MLTNRRIVPLVLVAALFVTCYLLLSQHPYKAYGETTFTEQTQTQNYQTFNFLAATSTIGTATSTNLTGGGGFLNIAGAKHVTFYFSRSATSTNNGSSSFTVQVSPDASPSEASWVNYNALEQNVATSTFPTVLSSVSIGSGTSTTMTFMRYLGYRSVRCISVLTQDGANTCKAGVEY